MDSEIDMPWFADRLMPLNDLPDVYQRAMRHMAEENARQLDAQIGDIMAYRLNDTLAEHLSNTTPEQRAVITNALCVAVFDVFRTHYIEQRR